MVKTFLFNKAQYRVGDEKGNQILLKIDYWNNSFEIETLKNGKSGFLFLKKEGKRIAKDLLNKKHKVNFSDRVTKKSNLK